MADESTQVTLDVRPTGRNGMAVVSAAVDGDTIHLDEFDLAKAARRDRFAATVAEGRDGIEPEHIAAELLQHAAVLAAGEQGQQPEDAQPHAVEGPEVDLSRIIRPERFILPEGNGVAIPTMTATGDRVAGRWSLYVRWADGRREQRAIGPTLDLPDGTRLWVHPQPTEPSPTMRPGWSAEARRRWLGGEPAPNAADVFQRLAERIEYFLEFPAAHAPGTTTTLACWTVLSYCYHAFPVLPYLYVGGPLGSGKSRVFEVLSRLVFRPLSSSNMTAAALFRTLHSRGGCLLLDEAERLKQTKDPDVAQLLSMLLAGYKQGGRASRLEAVGDSFRPVEFDVYGPKAQACIEGVPPALASRSICLMMFRAPRESEKPKRRIDADPDGWQRLRDDLHSLALEHGPTWLELADRTDVVPDDLSGRDYELWQPLLAITSFIEAAGMDGLLALSQEHALAVTDSAKDEAIPHHDAVLLRSLAAEIRSGRCPTPGEVLDLARAADPDGFRKWRARAVTSHLKRYNIATPIKSGNRREFRQVATEHLERIERSYGIDLDAGE